MSIAASKMLKNFIKLPLTQLNVSLLSPTKLLHLQLRTTFILKRRYPVPLQKFPETPRKIRNKHFIYDLIKDTSIDKRPDLNLILTQYVEGLGNAGEHVIVKAHYGYNALLLPGLAVYASPDNVEKYKNYKSADNERKHSSPNAERTMKQLSRRTLSLVMNKDNPWTLQVWHVRTSFRKCGFWVPDETIKMPEKPIKGPDMNLQDKEFYVTVTINNFEEVKVRCRIHHWSTDVKERIVHVHNFWLDTTTPIFPEDGPILESMPKKEQEVQTN